MLNAEGEIESAERGGEVLLLLFVESSMIPAAESSIESPLPVRSKELAAIDIEFFFEETEDLFPLEVLLVVGVVVDLRLI